MQKKFLFSIILCIFLLSFISFTKAEAVLPWEHSSTQVPFNGYYAIYEGWFYNMSDPIGSTDPIFFDFNIFYTNTTSDQDYIIQFNTSGSGLSLTIYEEGKINGTVDLRNRTIMSSTPTGNFSLLEFLYMSGWYDQTWIYNNNTVGDDVGGYIIWKTTTITVPLGTFTCYQIRACFSVSIPISYGIRDIYYDIQTGAMIRMEVTYFYPEIKQTAEVYIVGGNLEIEPTIEVNTILILAVSGVIVIMVFVGLRYRTNIASFIKREKKDSHIGRRKSTSKKDSSKKKDEKDKSTKKAVKKRTRRKKA